MTLARRAARGAAYILVSSYANMALGLAYGMVMARLLDPEHFGVYGLAAFFFNLFNLRAKLGLDYALVHRQPTTEALLATHWALSLASGLATVGITLIVGLLLPARRYDPATAAIMLALSGAMMLEALGSTSRAALEKELAFGRSTIVVTGALAASYLAAIGLAAAGLRYWALAGQVAVNALLGSIGFWWIYRRLPGRLPLRLALDGDTACWMLRFGGVMIVGAIATNVLLEFDNFLVGTFAGAAALGYYAQAYKTAQWPTGLVTHVVSKASLPTYAKLQDDPDRLSRAFELSLWLILTVATPLALAIFVSAPDFLRLLYGDKWLPSAPLLRLLIGYAVLRPILDDTGALFTAIGQPRKITTVLVVQAVTLAALATPLTLRFGAPGAAIGVGGAFIVGIGLTYRFISRTIKLDLFSAFAPPVVAAVGSVSGYLAVAALVDLNALPLFARVVVKGGLAMALFGVIVLAIERRALFERLRYLRQTLIG